MVNSEYSSGVNGGVYACNGHAAGMAGRGAGRCRTGAAPGEQVENSYTKKE